MKRCPRCDARYPDEHQFCLEDGTDLVAVNSPTPATKPLIAPQLVTNAAPPAGSRNALIGGAIVTGLVLILGIAMVVSGQRNQRQAAQELRLAQEARDAREVSTPEANAEEDVEEITPDAIPDAQIAVRFDDCTASASNFIRSIEGNQYAPRVVLDGLSSTAWNAENNNHGVGEWLQLTWPEARTISRIGVVVGYDKRSVNAKYQDDPWMWFRNNRLKTATLLFSGGERRVVNFADEPKMQYHDISSVRARWVRLIVDDVYLDKYDGRDPKWDDIAIGEIQVWGQP